VKRRNDRSGMKGPFRCIPAEQQTSLWMSVRAEHACRFRQPWKKETQMWQQVQLYLSRQASSLGRYIVEQTLYLAVGWIPTLVGLGVRGLLYRLIMRMDGMAAIENNVRLRFANYIRLGQGVYLDQNTYLHACPNGIEIGERTIVMHGAVLHVYNFRDLPILGHQNWEGQPGRRVLRHPRPGRGDHRRPGLYLAVYPDHRRQPRF
jgi:hypothetical protein